MKKLYIVSRLKASGSIVSDSGDLSAYTELGWELFTSGLHFKKMVLSGEINSEDFIMTHPDRSFIYQGIGPNVIDFDEKFINNFDGEVIDLTNNLMEILKDLNFRELTDLEKKALSFNGAKLSFSPTKKFVCFVLRLRTWVPDRGGPVDFWINQMKLANEAGFDVYCVGKESDKFIPNYAKHVSLEDYVGLISHDLCEKSIGPSSGCMLLNHAFGKSETNVIFFSDDYSQIDRGDGLGHLLIFGRQGNMNKNTTSYYKIK